MGFLLKGYNFYSFYRQDGIALIFISAPCLLGGGKYLKKMVEVSCIFQASQAHTGGGKQNAISFKDASDKVCCRYIFKTKKQLFFVQLACCPQHKPHINLTCMPYFS